MNRHRVILLSLLGLAISGLAAGGGDSSVDPIPPFAYHLRVVRVSGPGAAPGAAIGWAPNGGAPVVLPSEEAWGTPGQLEGLASLLGGARAEAVGGFYVVANEDGVLNFERKVYVGESVLDLSFRAVPPDSRKTSHEVELRLATPGSGEPPLAETKVLLATDRTVAIAAPGVVAGDWVVLAATPLEPAQAAARVRGTSTLPVPDGGEFTPPELLNRVAPEYPEGARRQKISGKIVLRVILDRDGVPRAPAILSMTPGTEELAGAAVDAVQQWRYKPATRYGVPVPVWFHIVVNFQLS